jgi:hypothetical protein
MVRRAAAEERTAPSSARRSVRDCVAGEVWHQVRRQVVGDVVVLLLLLCGVTYSDESEESASRMWIGSLAAAL